MSERIVPRAPGSSRVTRGPPLPSLAGLPALRPRRKQPQGPRQPLTKNSQYQTPSTGTAHLVRVRHLATMLSSTEVPFRTFPTRHQGHLASQLSHNSNQTLTTIPHAASWIIGSACP